MPNIFYCKSCDFKSSKESNFIKHISTRKHKNQQKINNLMPVVSLTNNAVVCVCGKVYKERSGLWRHSKVCEVALKNEMNGMKSDDNIVHTIENYNKNTKDDLIIKLIKDNDEMKQLLKEQQNQISELLPKLMNNTNMVINNNTTMNNSFNLNFFLNEQCKDALNISEFIDSLKITLEDLAYSRTNGLVEGITSVMIRGLKNLDLYKRPIHCTDLKRDTMYIKDSEKWEKDENHVKFKETIKKIANKERNAISVWVENNPDWFDTESKQMEYLRIINKVCEPIENEEKNERKIIKNIGKEVLVDKK